MRLCERRLTNLRLLPISRWLSHSFNNLSGSCGLEGDLSFSVLHSQFDHDFDALPILGELLYVITDFFGVL